MNNIPVIDITGLRSAVLRERSAVGAEIGAACRDVGFFYLTGHGVDRGLIDAVFDGAKKIFALPPEQKMQLAPPISMAPGYAPLGAQRLEADAPPDLKESFFMVPCGTNNRWPDGLPGWRETMEQYAAAMLALARLVMRGMALSLQLEEDHYDSFCDQTPLVAGLRLLYYPPQPLRAKPGEKGCGAHTDWGAVTFLLQDDSGGLQVEGPDGWLDATPLPNALVVNIGDMMARWTNDRYRSTMHRVINTSGKARYSVPFFFDGPPHYEVTCLPSCLDAGRVARYPPITVAQHHADMVKRTRA